MKFLRLFLIILLICKSFNGYTQDIDYTFNNYTLKDGLAGNNVYCATQDKDGFIWFGTETGLSRFDGSHFKNYTVADGLPDNEILNIFTDSKGRVWLVPFKKSLSYVYKQKIYNSENDSILKNIKILGNCYNITEDNEHNIIIHDTKAIHIINSSGKIVNILANSIGKEIQFMNVSKSVSGNVFVTTKREIFKLLKFNLVKLFSLPDNNIMNFSIGGQVVTDSSVILQNSISFKSIYSPMIAEYFFNNGTLKLYPSELIGGIFDYINNTFYSTTSKGIILINLQNKKINTSIDLNKTINRLFIDKEKNIYLLSRNNGIYSKPNSPIKQKNFNYNGNAKLAIDYLNGNNKLLFIGASNNNPIIIHKDDFAKPEYLSERENLSNSSFGKSESNICYINEENAKNIQLANANGLFIATKDNWKTQLYKLTIKHLQELDNFYLIGTSDKLILTNKSNYKITDTIWNERTTAANFIGDNYYIGTVNGLYNLNSNKVSTYLGDSFPIFKHRISSIKKSPDNSIWISTSDAGVVAYKNGKVLQIFNDLNGLTSNICRNLYINGNYAWVGTDKGLNKIDISKEPYKIVLNYTTTDGLASNMINAVYTDSNMVYVGTPEGLTYFDETKILNNSTCNMHILGITNSGNEQNWDSSKIVFEHKNNNIRIDFVAISFRAVGDIIYYYRLMGLDNEWKTTRENYISYPSLPSGNYTFEVKAINKFGKKSELVKINFEINKLLTEKIWFRVTLFLLILSLIYSYYNIRINKLKKAAIEKDAINEKVNEMEQMALKAQMNPHFIFNCLNSIQEYVINSDVKGANKFISDFSKLIRSTLDNSSKKVISIEDEIKYLTNYLTLEQYRFENKFEFNIFTNKELNLADSYIPPMLLQPYLENAIRHGINNKKDGQGFIQINMQKVNKNLVCEIIDNGIGIEASKKLKGKTHIEYQSKGMELTAKRIQLLNKTINEEIVVKIEEITHQETGTKVTITIPI
jgi:ligand-binding sensor domain-containing protein